MRIKIADVLRSGFDETVTLISVVLAFIVTIVKNLGAIVEVIKKYKSNKRYKKKVKKAKR